MALVSSSRVTRSDEGTWDVLVVGAGPAGASAAYWLAEHGHRVLVVERKRFPREKTCGDGLTTAAQDGRAAFAAAFMTAAAENPSVAQVGPVVLYETLGRTLPPDRRREAEAVHPQVEDGAGALEAQAGGHLPGVHQLVAVGVERHEIRAPHAPVCRQTRDRFTPSLTDS